MNTHPKWYTHPNDILTAEDILEKLEYEKIVLNRIEREYINALTPEGKDRAYLDLVNAKFRVANLEDSLERC